MSVDRDLVTAIVRLLPNVILPILSTTLSNAKLFESYLFCLVVNAALREGGQVELVDGQGRPTDRLAFRLSPGTLASAANYTCAVIRFAGKEPLEAHVDVKFSGASGVAHECDVSVVRQSEAETCRRNRSYPRQKALVLAFEAKFYSSLLPLDLARSFIGLTSDIPSGCTIFVSNTKSASVEKFLTRRNRHWQAPIAPRATGDVERLRNEIQDEFKKFKAV